MNTYNIVLKDSTGAQKQVGVSASTWQNAIDAAKKDAGLETAPSSDASLLIVQWTGIVHVIGE